MKSMERFGSPLFSYEGVGSVEVGIPADAPMKIQGYFEAANFPPVGWQYRLSPSKASHLQRFH